MLSRRIGRRRHRLPTNRSSPAHPDSKPVSGRARAALRRAEALRRSARGAAAAARSRRRVAASSSSASPRVALQMKDYATAEQLLLELKAAELRRARRGRPLSRADRRGDQALRRGDRALPRGARRRARLAREAAHRRAVWRSMKRRRRRRAASSPSCPAVTIEQRVQVRQAEAQMLREAGDDAGAYAVLAKALDELPDSHRPALRRRDGRREARSHRRGREAPRAASSS